MKFLSLFSGIEACSVAWKPLGWGCVGVSEIDAFPCSLLSHYYPDVPNLGDVTKVSEQQVAELGKFDVLVFGSPCQDLSIAGGRKGLQGGTRSNLFYEALRIFDYARQHNQCRFALWENVTGAFSSNKGTDFAAVVREMAGLRNVPVPANGWGNAGVAVGENGLLEWGVLDAQYFGLAQRRKRVFAIIDTGNWYDRPPILFEPESLSGNIKPSRETGGKTAFAARDGITTSSGAVSGHNRAGYKRVYICHGSQHPISNEEELANCLGRNSGMENTLAYMVHDDPTPKISDGVAGTLRSQGGGGVVPPSVIYGFDSKQQHVSITEDKSTALVASGCKEPLGIIAGDIIGRGDTSGGNQVGIYEGEISPTLTTADQHAIVHDYVVRRLTPTECERLMGFPDGYTDVLHKGKPASNSARYKALGNSMAVNVMQYIGTQIERAMRFNSSQQDTKMITQSPTSLQTFLTCPKQYEAKYITKEVKFEQNPHATFGDLVHKFIERYLKYEEALPPMLKSIEPTLKRMRPILVGAEERLAVDKQGNVVDFFDKNAYQRCIVDAIIGDPERYLVCIDWKTGKKRDAQTQHDFIKKCVKAKYPKAEVITLFVYLFVGGSDRQRYNGGGLVGLSYDMSNLAAAYATNSFPPRPSGLCKKWCDVASCPHNGRSNI